MIRFGILTLIAATFATAGLPQDVIRPVRLMSLNAQTVDMERQFFGQIAARQTVDLAFQVAGQIVDFSVVEGHSVAQGDLIAQLDLETFELKLEQAQLQKDQADRALARLNTLGSNTVSQVAIDDAQTATALATINLRNAEYALEHASLHAPFDGLIAARNVANFTTINAGTSIVRLHDMSEIRVEIDVPEVLFQQAGHSDALELVGIFPGDPTQYLLEIREFNAEASTVGQTFRLTLALLESPASAVLPGSSISVIARLPNQQTEITLPPTALVIAPDTSLSVMLFEPTQGDEGIVRSIAVDVAALPNGQFHVVSGLESGGEIVSAGASALSDGQTVRRFTGFSN